MANCCKTCAFLIGHVGRTESAARGKAQTGGYGEAEAWPTTKMGYYKER